MNKLSPEELKQFESSKELIEFILIESSLAGCETDLLSIRNKENDLLSKNNLDNLVNVENQEAEKTVNSPSEIRRQDNEFFSKGMADVKSEIEDLDSSNPLETSTINTVTTQTTIEYDIEIDEDEIDPNDPDSEKKLIAKALEEKRLANLGRIKSVNIVNESSQN